MQQGIYQIRNIKNNKIYIGSTVNFNQRKEQHFYSLKVNKHHSQYLQNAYNKYKKENFVFEILKIVDDLHNLHIEEQNYINILKPLYNMRKNVDIKIAEHKKVLDLTNQILFKNIYDVCNYYNLIYHTVRYSCSINKRITSDKNFQYINDNNFKYLVNFQTKKGFVYMSSVFRLVLPNNKKYNIFYTSTTNKQEVINGIIDKYREYLNNNWLYYKVFTNKINCEDKVKKFLSNCGYFLLLDNSKVNKKNFFSKYKEKIIFRKEIPSSSCSDNINNQLYSNYTEISDEKYTNKIIDNKFFNKNSDEKTYNFRKKNNIEFKKYELKCNKINKLYSNLSDKYLSNWSIVDLDGKFKFYNNNYIVNTNITNYNIWSNHCCKMMKILCIYNNKKVKFYDENIDDITDKVNILTNNEFKNINMFITPREPIKTKNMIVANTKIDEYMFESKKVISDEEFKRKYPNCKEIIYYK